MKAIEVTGTVNSQGQLSLDKPLTVTEHTRVRVIVLLAEEQDKIAWLETDLSNLSEYESYEWESEELEQGLPVEIDSEKGVLIVEE